MFFSGESLRVFHHSFLRCFHFSGLIFTTAFWYISWYHQLSLPWLIFCCFFVLFFLHCFTASDRIWESFFYSQVFFTLQSLPTFAAVSRVLRIWESVIYSQLFCTLHFFQTFSTTYFYQGVPGSRQFFLEVSRIFHLGWKHWPGQSLYLNHTVFSKRY